MSDNIFTKQCPALMSDQRFLTNHNNPTTINQAIRLKIGVYSTHDYRNYLQNNALSMMETEKTYNMMNNRCAVSKACSHGFNTQKYY